MHCYNGIKALCPVEGEPTREKIEAVYGSDFLYQEAVNETYPQALVEAAEFSGELHRWMQTELTDYERQVFRLFLAGYPYSEIASLLSSHSKAVDNALQRVRRKLRKFYSTHSVSA